jgi:hypothetical protein
MIFLFSTYLIRTIMSTPESNFQEEALQPAKYLDNML